MEDQVGFKTSCHYTQWASLLVSIIILWYFHTQIQLNAPYPAMFFSYMQNASFNAILKAKNEHHLQNKKKVYLELLIMSMLSLYKRLT